MTSAWRSVRSGLEREEKTSLLKLLKEIYDLNRENREFLEARFAALDPSILLEPFKRRIDRALSPDPYSNPNGKISVAIAKKAVSDYRKASRDVASGVDLMLFYVECGTDFAADYGYGEEPYFRSLEGMFEAALKDLPQVESAFRSECFERIDYITDRADAIGWGYPDTLRYILEQAPVVSGR